MCVVVMGGRGRLPDPNAWPPWIQITFFISIFIYFCKKSTIEKDIGSPLMESNTYEVLIQSVIKRLPDQLLVCVFM